jgi:hypothetical protein
MRVSTFDPVLVEFAVVAPALALTIPEIVQEGKALEDKLSNLKDQLLDLRSGYLSLPVFPVLS